MLSCSQEEDAFGTRCACLRVLCHLLVDDPECQVLHLSLFQGSCCDNPPDFCTLCENGSQNYNIDKVIPRNVGDPPIERSCEDYANVVQFLKEGASGFCRDTERARARTWCECDGATPACPLTCDDGNPPPDLTKTDPVYGESCERFVYEYTTLSQEECSSPSLVLDFNGKAFCCNEPAPNDCSICPAGKMLASTDKVVTTEFFGSSTCGEIATYASYLYPNTTCSVLLADLLDKPFGGAEDECCVDDPNSEGLSSTSSGINLSIVFAGVLLNNLALLY